MNYYVCINLREKNSIFVEYEGSPRRIGQMGNTNDEEHMTRISNKLLQSHIITPNLNAAVTVAKTNNFPVNGTSIATAATVVSAATTSTITATNSPKEQQHYSARPGFPQVSKTSNNQRQTNEQKTKIVNNNANEINISFRL